MAEYTSLFLSFKQDKEIIDFNLSSIDTSLLYPLIVQIRSELYQRSLKIDFSDERIKEGKIINPKNLNVQYPENVQLQLFKNSKLTS